MDRELVLQIYGMDEIRLCRRLRPYLNRLQIAAVRHRIRSIRKAIAQSEKLRPDFLLDTQSWNDRTVAEEVSGRYGKTYLTKSNQPKVPQ